MRLRARHWLAVAVSAVGINIAAGAEPANPCGFIPGPGSKPLSYSDVAVNAKAFQCAPSPIGTGTTPTLRSNAAGAVAWWYCPSERGEFHLNWAAATSEQLSAAHLFEQAVDVLRASDPSAAFAAATTKSVTLPLSDPALTPVWCPYFGEMIRATPPAVPPRSASGASAAR